MVSSTSSICIETDGAFQLPLLALRATDVRDHRFRFDAARALLCAESLGAPLRVVGVTDFTSCGAGARAFASGVESGGVGFGNSFRSAMPHKLEAMK
jgi:hypothetical protein